MCPPDSSFASNRVSAVASLLASNTATISEFTFELLLLPPVVESGFIPILVYGVPLSSDLPTNSMVS